MNQHRTIGILPHLSLILVFLIWGVNNVSMKLGGTQWNPFVFNGLRFAAVLPVFWIYTWFYYRSRSLHIDIAYKDIAIVCGLGVLNAIGLEVILQYSLQYTNAANGAVLGRGMVPIIIAIISLAFAELKLSWRIAVGIPSAFLGVLLLVVASDSGFHMGPDTFRGDALLLLRSIIGAFHLIFIKRMLSKYPLTLLLSIEMTAASLSLLPFVIWQFNPTMFSSITHVGWQSFIYTTLCATIIGYSLHNWALARMGPFKSSVYGYLIPIAAAVSGYYILHEKLTPFQFMGGVVIMLSMYLVQSDRQPQVKKNT